jgi:hypothetical protein
MATTILRRTGAVLAVACLLCLALTAYRGAAHWPYIAGINTVGLIAAIFLLRGSLAAAPVVRAAAAFGAAATIIGLAGLTLLQPFDLTRTELRLDPASFLWPTAAAVFAVAIQMFVVGQLGLPRVQAEIAGSRWESATAAKAGAAAGCLAMLLMWYVLHGTSAAAAEALALEQLGPRYQYALTSLGRETLNGKSVISGIVTAWNDNEIKQVVLHWTQH